MPASCCWNEKELEETLVNILDYIDRAALSDIMRFIAGFYTTWREEHKLPKTCIGVVKERIKKEELKDIGTCLLIISLMLRDDARRLLGDIINRLGTIFTNRIEDSSLHDISSFLDGVSMIDIDLAKHMVAENTNTLRGIFAREILRCGVEEIARFLFVLAQIDKNLASTMFRENLEHLERMFGSGRKTLERIIA